MIIDIHAHTSYKELHSLHTKSATLDVIEDYTKKYGVSRVYLMTTYFPLKNSGTENYPMLKIVGDKKLFRIFGSLDFEKPCEPAFQELRDLASKKLIAGIKLYPGYQNINLADPKVYEACKIADDFSLPIAIHTGELHHCCREHADKSSKHKCGFNTCAIDKRSDFAKADLLANLAKSFPKTNFIACHMSNPDFKALRDVMKSSHNIYTDMSGQFLSETNEDTPEYRLMLKKEMEKTILDCGVEKLLFGTDFPIQSYKDSIELVQSLSITEADKDLIFYKNATNVLKEELTCHHKKSLSLQGRQLSP